MSDRLDTVLRVRRIQEQQRQADAVAASDEERRARRDLARAAQERLSWAFPSGAGFDAASLRHHQLATIALHDAEAAAQLHVDTAVDERAAADEAFTEARTATKSVEQLAERRAVAAAAAAAAHAQAAADELALLTLSRKDDR